MSHSKCVVPCGTTERERNDSDCRTIVDFGGIKNRRELVRQQFSGAPEGVEGKDRPGKTPRGEACPGASLKPVKARSYKIVRTFIQERQQRQGCHIGMGSERKSVHHAVARVPTSLRASSVVQHLHAAPDTKTYEVLL
jgi:hypothetical protein